MKIGRKKRMWLRRAKMSGTLRVYDANRINAQISLSLKIYNTYNIYIAYIYIYIQGISGGVNILGGGSMDYSQ